jgi:hypothetical protein
MPIKGVSEIVRLPRLGKIRLGVKNETSDGVSYPSPTDYFVCPDEVKKMFGEKPKGLRIMFPTEDEKQWASQFYRCYSATRGLICRGDGETAMARIDNATGEISTRDSVETELREIICNPAKCSLHQKDRCRRVMNLQFLLPDCPGFGVYQLDTTSFYSIVNINSSLDLIHGTCGRLSMIPLSLKLVEQEVQREGKKKTVRVLSLTAPYSFAQIQKYARIPPGQVLLLPPPDCEAPDDLFPEETLNHGQSSTESELDGELVQVYDKAKLKVWELGVQDFQVANYFSKNYHLEVGLEDFREALPPEKFTIENLTSFLKDIDLHTRYF